MTVFNPRYAITDKLLENIKRITELITQLNSKRLPRVVLHAMEKEARELSAHTSTSIEGNPLPLAEVKRILKNRPENLRDTERLETLGLIDKIDPNHKRPGVCRRDR